MPWPQSLTDLRSSVSRAGSGLCNKLRVLLSYRQVALAQQRRLVVLWGLGPQCDVPFHDLFEPIEYVHCLPWREEFTTHTVAGVSERRLTGGHLAAGFEGASGLSSEVEEALIRALDAQRGALPWIFDCHVSVVGTPAETSMYSLLRPTAAIREAVAARVQACGEGYAAAHVRRTDHVALFGDLGQSSDEDFYAFFERHGTRPCFLATDNAATQQAYAQRLGTARLRAPSPIPPKGSLEASQLRHTSVELAVVDLWTCVHAAVFKGTTGSVRLPAAPR